MDGTCSHVKSSVLFKNMILINKQMVHSKNTDSRLILNDHLDISEKHIFLGGANDIYHSSSIITLVQTTYPDHVFGVPNQSKI